MVLTRSMENLNLLGLNTTQQINEHTNNIQNNLSPLPTTSINTTTTLTNENMTLSLQNRNGFFVKLLKFWIENHHARFIHVETLFNIHNISDENVKYQNVIVALSQEVVAKIIDIVQVPSTTNKYEKFKNALSERFLLGPMFV